MSRWQYSIGITEYSVKTAMYGIQAMTDTSMRISTENRQELKRLMPDAGETYDEVISELLENYE